MKKNNLSDEELLSYLIGDCEESLSNHIKCQLKENLVLRRRMETIMFIKGEIRNSSVSFKLKKQKGISFSQLGKQLVLCSLVFMIGLFAQSNFEILAKKNMEVLNQNISVSKPLSWDDSRFLSLM